MPTLVALAVDWTPALNALVYALAALVVAAMPLVLLVLALVRQWLLRRVQRDAYRAAVERALQVVEVEVKALEQTLKGDLRAQAPDGRLTPQEAAELAQLAAARVKQTLGAAGCRALDAATGSRNLDAWLGAAIEAKVLEVKLARNAADPWDELTPVPVPPSSPGAAS